MGSMRCALYFGAGIIIRIGVCVARSKFVVKRKCAMKLVSPVWFYGVWCLDDFSKPVWAGKTAGNY